MYIDRAAKKPRSLRFDVDDDDKDKFTDAAAYKGHFEKRLVELRKSSSKRTFEAGRGRGFLGPSEALRLGVLYHAYGF